MVSPFLTLLAGAIILLLFRIYRWQTYWKRHGVPTVSGCLPILGHLWPILIAKKSFSDLVTDAYNEKKGCSMVGFYKILTPVLVVCEPALIKTVLQSNFSSFQNNGLRINPEADPLLMNNPFFTNGPTWTTSRKRLTSAFSNTRLKILFGAVEGVSKKFQNFLNRRLKSKDTYEVELKYLFSKFTGEVVANAGLGIEGQCFEDEVHPYAFDQIGHAVFKTSVFDGLMTMLLLFFPNLNNLLKISFVPKKLANYFLGLVSENLRQRRNASTPRNDFLQLMIDMESTDGKVSEQTIAGHAFSFFGDGFETSSLTLSFVGYELATHPDIQQKLREQIKDVVAKTGGTITFDGLKEITYMDQVISESMRQYPALGMMSKVCTEEFELHGSDGISYRAKPGDEIMIPLSAIQRDAKYWDDPDTYDPERFNDDRKRSIEKMTFLPFGEGPRICVGMRMAMLQMKCCLATLIMNYKLELSSKTQVPLKMSPVYFLHLPIGGIWVHITKL